MDFSTKVNLGLAIGSFVLAAASIITVVITLLQNHKIFKESTRPYITIYIDSITICEQTSFFVLKNFGHSAATITHFEYDECLKNTEQSSELMNRQFDYVNGITLAPGQSKLLQFKMSALDDKDLTFVIKYVNSQNRKFKEKVVLNSRNYIRIPEGRPNSDIAIGYERQVHTLREIVERLI